MRTLLFQGYLWGYILSKANKSFTINRLNKAGLNKDKLKLMDKIILKCTKNLIKISGAELTVTGTENIPLDEPVLYVSNHQGNMDIPILYSTAPQTMAFVAKKEMEKIPMLGYWMKERGCVFINRENARSSLKAINQAIVGLKAGNSIAVFPEGTRSKGPEMGDFKPGSLRIAIKSGVKVIPVTLKDSYKLIGKKGKCTPAKVHVHYAEPIDSRNFKDTNELASAVLTQIKKHL
ncbi:1-acyl-sn-glycerol-3-phosphate acyltransferase [Sporosarcina pasteurii]|uniref:1-acyl-sn-glycerol-3-phosphate acyltransferase n=1 Tax=Sporosarcina pasteurii TaxID=1474 RepID=A0A380CFH0_SPOPA|nr:lysophospholipid acyltransferase family protein [Sporosarcina pasteurii]MDS9473177.1 lysophospholipid acyltransferase family protein [Sporosarcina pasteurii]QBQ06913.1 1-acyl-sn-glycerol-3-phosphate acyltransferase [Sporosarcina pasteurii]SUJ19653.1 1-acyl-sn-glycerol-3-phosphate acyltransferase [Sporosarcina pasteurii]